MTGGERRKGSGFRRVPEASKTSRDGICGRGLRWCAALLLLCAGGLPARAEPWPEAPPPASAPAAAPLSLADAQRIALQEVSTLRQAEIDEAVAAEDLRQARAGLLPRIRDAWTLTYNSPERGADPPVASFIAANAVHEYQNLIGVTGELGVGTFSAVRRARALLDAARAGTAVARRTLMRGVAEAFYGAALAEAKRSAAEQSLAAAAEFERVTALGVEAGEAPEVDAIRARLQTAARRDDLNAAAGALTAANAAFAVLLGRNPASAVAVEALPQEADAGQIGAITAAGVARRPELQQAAARERAARADVSVSRGDLLPRITYSLDKGFDTDSRDPDVLRRHRGTLATANVDVPIFDWGATFSKVRQARLRAREAANDRLLTSRELAVEFVTARAEATAAAQRIDNARLALADAEKNVTISIARYRAGEAPISEATDAQTTRAQQRLALQQALYDFQVAMTHLREAAGE